ncbi:MAG: OprD family porin, partial [Zoogloeaceae bacterium]|nr:OprD family porin [Zoogloeaceae bacterium]
MNRTRPFLLALALTSAAQSAWSENGGAWARFASELKASEVSGNLMYFQRNRERYRTDARRFDSNLHHRTLQGSLEVSSPFLAGTAGFDLGVFATGDLHNSASPDHEISFFPWSDPWSPDWSKKDARGGASLYRAHLKLRHAREGGLWWGKLGYFQPSGPGVLGVNWSLTPGTYLGAEGGIEGERLSLAGAYVTEYKAPWYRKTYAFREDDAAQTKIDRLWSFGARYAFTPETSAEIAYGEAPGFLQSAHVKLKYRQAASTTKSPLYLSYQLYVMGDHDDSTSVGEISNNHYAGRWAFQHYLAFTREFSRYVLKGEFLHTRAPSTRETHLGYFVYRLSGRYGGANGAYEPWWDNRSDWNHNRESAVFASLSRSLDDLIDLSGVTLTLSAARGWGGKAHGVPQTLKEAAWSLDFTWVIPSGALKDARISLH